MGNSDLALTLCKFIQTSSLEDLNIKPKRNRLTTIKDHSQIWRNVANEVTHSLESVGIEYSLMKVFDVPYVHMEDVDLLIENKENAQKALDLLRSKSFTIVRDPYSTDPFKITAIPNSGIQIDIYSQPAWFNMKYAPKYYVTTRREKRKICGVEAYSPPPTIDLYIVATHAYNHGFISIAEAAYLVSLIKNNAIDWQLLKHLAKAYELQHAVYLSLKIVQLALPSDAEIKSVLHGFEKDDRLTRIYAKWFSRTSTFPVKIPLLLRLTSATARLFKPKLKDKTRTYDELLGYFLAFIFRGDKRKRIEHPNNLA